MRLKLALVFAVLLVAAAAAGCGGDGADTSSGEKTEAPSGTSEHAEPVDEADDSEDAESELAPVEFLLPEAVKVPESYEEVLADCAEPTAAEGEYRSVYGFAVPSGWKAQARSEGGSGSLLSADVSLGFETGEGRVRVEMDHDNLDENGVVMDWNQEPFTTFDEEVTVTSSSESGEKQFVTTFEDLGPITLEGQEATLWRAAQEQNPEYLSSTRYKARIETASIPAPNVERSNAVTKSIVVTIDHDADENALDEAVVREIIGSFALAPCVREETYKDLELMLGEDLDGDGEVRSPEDLLAELQEMQEEQEG